MARGPATKAREGVNPFTGEKQMFVKAKKILASELMYAKNMSEEDTIVWLEDVLTSQHKPKTASAAKKPAAKKPAAEKPAADEGKD